MSENKQESDGRLCIDNVPEQCHDALLQNSRAQLAHIILNLRRADELNDLNKGGKYYILRLDDYMSAKYPFLNTEREELANLMFGMLFKCDDVMTRGIVASVLTKLLKKKLDNCVPKNTRLNLDVQWRPLWDLIWNSFAAPGTMPITPKAVERRKVKELSNLVATSRRYFPKGTTREILALASPSGTTDSLCFRTQAMLQLFLPMDDCDEAKDFILPVFERLDELDMCNDTLFVWISLLARAVKKSVGTYDWSPLLPKLFNLFLQSLNLTVGVSNNPTNNRNIPAAYTKILDREQSGSESIAACIARIAVFNMYEGTNAMQLTRQFLDSVITFFHPSNYGRWSVTLGWFVYCTCYYYIRRLAHERDGNAKYDKKYFLDRDNMDMCELLYPIATLSLYSKIPRLVSCAGVTLRELAVVFPDHVMPKLLDEFYPSLENLDQPHRMYSALKTLVILTRPLVDRQLFPQGAAHLPRLLTAVLPAIDTADSMKLTNSLSWLSYVFANVAFIDAMETDKLPKSTKPDTLTYTDAMVETEDDARRATMSFGEWSREFLTKIIENLENADKFTKKSMQDVTFKAVLSKCLENFFACLSKPIFTQCVHQIKKFIMVSHKNDASKYFGLLLMFVGWARPDVSLPILFPALAEKVICKKGGEYTLAPSAESELKWFACLTSQLVKRAGAAVLPFMDDIRGIAKATSDHKEKPIRKYGARVLRSSMRALCYVYPSEGRAFSTKQWNEDEQWKHWQRWGMFSEIEDGVDELDITWHWPSEEELKVCSSVASEEILTITQDIRSFVQSKDEGNEELMKQLALKLKATLWLVNGLTPLLGFIEGKEEETDDDGDHYREDGGVATYQAPRCPPLLSPIRLSFGGDVVNLRTGLVEMCLGLNDKLKGLKGKASGDHLAVWKALAKLLDKLLAVYGPGSNKYADRKMMETYERFWHRENFYDKKVHIRPLKVKQSSLLFETRYLDQQYPPCNSTIRRGLVVVQELSVNEFEKLRQISRRTLTSVMQRFGDKCIDSSLQAMYKVLEDKESEEKKLLGAIEVLNSGQCVGWIKGSWERSSAFIHCLTHFGEQHNEDKVQATIHTLFMHVFEGLYTLPLSIDKVKESPLLGADRVTKRNKGIDKLTTTWIRAYTERMSELLSCVKKGEKGDVHWRYQLMGSAFLLRLLRDDLPTEITESTEFAELLRFFCRGLVCELHPLRRLCIVALSQVLQHHSKRTHTLTASLEKDAAKVQEAISSLCVPLDEGIGMKVPTSNDLKSARFCDYNYSGWGGKNVVLRSSSSSSSSSSSPELSSSSSLSLESLSLSSSSSPFLPDGVLKELESFFAKEMKRVIQTLVGNHPTLSKASGGRGRGRSQKGAGDAIGTAVYQKTGLQWPFTRLSLHSNAFDIIHANLIRRLAECIPALTDSLMSEMAKLAENTHEEEEQCTAAEMVAGIARAFKHRPSEQPAALEGVVRSVLAQCQPDCVNHWMDSIQLTSSNADPRRIAWLVNLLTTSAFSSFEPFDDSPSSYYKHLRFIQPLLVEGSWRLGALAPQLFARLKRGWLFHPYKQVRSEVGYVLYLLCRNSHNAEGKNEALDDFLAYVSETLDKVNYLVTSAPSTESLGTANHMDTSDDNGKKRKRDDSAGKEDEKDNKEKEKEGKGKDKREQHLIETLIYWMTACFHGGDLREYSRVYMTLLPHVLRAQHHPDPTCAALAKMCTQYYAWTRVPSELVPAVIKTIKAESKSPSWHVRASVAKYLLIFAPRHSLLLSEKQVSGLMKLCRDLMQDGQLEVRHNAATALGGLISSTMPSPENVAKQQKRLFNLAKTKLIKGKGPESMVAMNKRHAGVLGLSTFVKCHPYDLPDWCPAILAYLANHINDPQPIKGDLTKIFADFKRTHKDMWHIFKEKFTEDELEAYQGVSLAPSYFA